MADPEKKRSASEKKKIGELLVESGYVSPGQLQQALEIQKKKRERIWSILMDLGHLTEEDFLEFLSTMPGAASVDLSSCEIDRKILDLIPGKLARRLEVVPIGKIGNSVTMAMVCPFDKAGLNELGNATRMKVRPVLCSRSAVLGALDSYYKESEEKDLEPEMVDDLSAKESEEKDLEPEMVGDLSAKESEEKDLEPEMVGDLSAKESEEKDLEPEMVGDLSALEGPLKLRRVAKLVEEIGDLPTLPDIFNRVSQVVNDPNSSAADLAKVIATDGSLSAKLLKLANSPAYGFSRKISDIKHAIALLGFRETQVLAMSVSVFDQLISKAEFDFRTYWNHSFACATLTRLISRHLKVGGMETAFVAGLLHDVGKVLLAMEMGGKQERAALLQSSTGMTRVEAEEKVLGISHAEVGYLLGEHWLLPTVVTDAIRYHHSPELEPEPKAPSNVVFLANNFCKMDTSQPAENVDLDDKVLEVLKILEMPEGVLRSTLESYSEIASEIPPL